MKDNNTKDNIKNIISLNYIISEIKVDKFFMITQDDLNALCTLIDSINANIMIEFGVQQGCTASAILKTFNYIHKYIGIDVEKGYEPFYSFQKKEIPYDAGCYAKKDARFNLITKPKGTFDISYKELPIADIIFIDGDHSIKGIINDTILAFASIRKYGIVCWHDYRSLSIIKKALSVLSNKFNLEISCLKDSNIAYTIFDLPKSKFIKLLKNIV
ncbi:MAG: class I SAM-dependent methyltransferase [Oscillospiraceae bacterium]|jgi:hypothetical protein|nr:class I SAM-dependent methyltransferase [Oscillospiraceae bacterium]